LVVIVLNILETTNKKCHMTSRESGYSLASWALQQSSWCQLILNIIFAVFAL